MLVFFFGEASIVNSTLQNGISRKLLATHGDDDAVNAAVIVGVAVITHNYHTWIFTRCDISFLRDSFSPLCPFPFLPSYSLSLFSEGKYFARNLTLYCAKVIARWDSPPSRARGVPHRVRDCCSSVCACVCVYMCTLHFYGHREINLGIPSLRTTA